MGGLIPNGNDVEVIEKLNTTFQGNKLANLRRHIADNADDLFANTRHLHRISHRLKIFPTSGARPKGRWYVSCGSHRRCEPHSNPASAEGFRGRSRLRRRPFLGSL